MLYRLILGSSETYSEAGSKVLSDSVIKHLQGRGVSGRFRIVKDNSSMEEDVDFYILEMHVGFIDWFIILHYDRKVWRSAKSVKPGWTSF